MWNWKPQPLFPKRESLGGKWKFYETCISPSNQSVPEKINDEVIVEFQKDSRFSVSDLSKSNLSLPCGGNWKVLKQASNSVFMQFQFTFACNKAIYTFYFSFNDNNTLNLNPPCIEECRFTYMPLG